MLGLHNLKSAPKATHRRKRVGRGSGSGRGNYSARGMKGQRSRSGGKSGLALRAVRTYVLRIPKTRGFRSIYPKYTVVNLGQLDKHFEAGQTINARALVKKGLIASSESGVKILSGGQVKKKFIIEASAFSASAKAQIEAAGGQAKVVVQKKIEAKKEAGIVSK